MSSPFLSKSAMLALCYITGLASANPITQQARQVQARSITGYTNCSPDQTTKLQQGFADAETLARFAFDHVDTSSTTWTHYMRAVDPGMTDDLNYAKKVWSAVESNSSPNNPPYQFTVNCDDKDSDVCKSGKTVAFTEAQPQEDDSTPRVMHICPLFFSDSSKETVNDLNSRKFVPPKAKRGDPDNWCEGGKRFGFYEVAGHTLLHEMTHFDALGKYAGLPEVQDDEGFSAHGTEDVGGLGNDYPIAARKLAQLWKKKPDGNYLPPYRNAESLAAAALEIYMTVNCAAAPANAPIGEIPQ